jgi:hypothetical protein
MSAEEHTAWIRSFRTDQPEQRGVHRVGELLPAGYDSYLRLFHPYVRNPEFPESLPPRRTWSSLAEEAGVVYHAELSTLSLRSVLGGKEGPRPYWVAEGYLDPETRDDLVAALTDSVPTPALFLFGLASQASGGETMVFCADASESEAVRAVATEAVPMPIGRRRLPIEYMWATDKSWIVATDYDLHSTYVACASDAAARIASDPVLEVLDVTRSTRIDWYGDLINGTGYVERPAGR